MQPLYETERPPTWDKVIGQEDIIKKMDILRRRGFVGRNFWLVGKSGHGKTTIARLIAEEIADAFATTEIDAQDLLLENLRKYKDNCGIKPIGRGVYAYIINEAYAMDYRTIRLLQTVLEDRWVQKNSTWIFTGTPDGEEHMRRLVKESNAFLSRCIRLELASGAETRLAFAKHCQQVAKREELDGRPLKEYLKLAEKCGGNCREMLQRIDAGEML